MDSKLTAAMAEKIYLEQPFEFFLLDDLTGRIKVICRRDCGRISGKWQLEVDGERHSFGQFLINGMSAGESREFLLSVEVPDIYWGQEAVLIVRLFDESGDNVAAEAFAMHPAAYLMPPAGKDEFFTGLRFDVSQAIISSGKLSAVIDANGMRELRYNGEKLLNGGPRLSLFRAGKIPDSLRDLKLDRIKIAADRFVSDGKSVECHALALPGKMEMDELEFTQRFTPQNDGSIRYDAEFVVPESFVGIPRLGVVMRLPSAMDELEFYGKGPHENYPGQKSGIKSRYSMKCIDSYPDYDMAVSGGTRSEVKEIVLRDAAGKGLKIIAGREVAFSALPFSEYTIDDALRSNRLPESDGDITLHIDLRIGDVIPAASGVCRLTVFFKSC